MNWKSDSPISVISLVFVTSSSLELIFDEESFGKNFEVPDPIST
jgi:hypothetical protein